MKRHIAFIVFILLLLFSIAGCHSSQEPNAPSTVSKDNSFFPLKTGNKWFYSSNFADDSAYVLPNISMVWEVKGSKTFGDKTFYLVEETDYDYKGDVSFVDTNYYSVKSDSLFCIEDPQPSGDSYIQFRGCFSSGSEKFIVIPYSNGNLAGRLVNKTDSLVTFNYYREPWPGSPTDLPSWRTTFEKGIGMTATVVTWSQHGNKLVRYELK